ncbi:lysophospholipid acyltransferase family protein [Paenibacillus wulumuqiensis]|uniref:lysophospholipid acyltransferase family protein n=1 Tax=Paenibacillus wulumuqiensis TaxID=1567107 RepID=UPI0006195C81|nr:lysophospholipid acyltransferase family protein [Paenibacillus wulumuqiensis]
MFYRFIRALIRFFYRILFRIKAEGLEHIPQEGGVLLCSNHISNLDPPMVGILIKRQVRFMAKEELFHAPVLGPIIARLGAFPVKRGGISKESIRTALTILREGGIMGIFPEGTRNSQAAAAKRGAATFALRSDAAVIPAAIIGNYKLFRTTKVVYGPPVDLSAYKGKDATGTAEEATEKIMEAIRKIIRENQ